MSNREEILNSIRENIHERYEMPSFDNISPISYKDRVAQFTTVVNSVGGSCVELLDGESIDEIIKQCYPTAKKIASSLEEVQCATIDPSNVETPHELNGVDLAVVHGAIGVAENGCVWIPQDNRHKATCFIAEHLLIVLSRDMLVDNMHQAYDQITMNDHGFGVFISGPSKTADIEQSLVVGAHGARGVTVLIR